MVENKHVSPNTIQKVLQVIVDYKKNTITSAGTIPTVNTTPYVATDIFTKQVAKHVFPRGNKRVNTPLPDLAFDAMAVINVGYDLSGVTSSYQNYTSQLEYYDISLKNHNNLNGIIRGSSVQLTHQINRSIVDVLADRNTNKPIQSYKTVLVLTDIIDTLDYKNSADLRIIDGIIQLAKLFDFTYLTFSEMYKSQRCRYYPFKYKGGIRYRVIPNYTGFNYSPTMYANFINARIQSPLNPLGDEHMYAHVNDDLVVIDRGQYNFNDCVDNYGFTHMFNTKEEKDAYLSANNVTPIYKHDITV
ncbi:MAG: hypothetical protein U0L42_00120 [Methanobrevibacter sp.]|uniref:hypothetical protein n=1 Tax=Methanobrevibacter sp. TaxID=66852 RepID=UPI002E781B14|nr:hypothetical protein [Methanobrevibacter sp.]MEE0934053.1 hypothetical protein [Methanobrevibacter sp.]